jgi:hypothetical protein
MLRVVKILRSHANNYMQNLQSLKVLIGTEKSAKLSVLTKSNSVNYFWVIQDNCYIGYLETH